MAFNAQPLFPGMLCESAIRLADSVSPVVPDSRAASRTASAQLWASALEMGWASVLVDEKCGGMDGSLSDVAAMVEGLALQGVAAPVIERCAAVPTLLRLVADSHSLSALRQSIAEGSAHVGWLSGDDGARVEARALDDGRYQLSGARVQSEASVDATHYLLIVSLDEGGRSAPALLLLDAEPLAQAMQDFDAADETPMVDLDLAHLGGPIEAACLAHGDGVLQAELEARSVSTLLVCVDSLSRLAALLEQTVEHLSTRIQFDVPLASFQALRHKAVDVFVMYETARGLVAHVCARAEEGLADAARDIRLAKYYMGKVGRLAAEIAIQMHGAMGMSQELPAARLAKRLITNDFRHGDRLYQGARLASTLARDLAAAGDRHA